MSVPFRVPQAALYPPGHFIFATQWPSEFPPAGWEASREYLPTSDAIHLQLQGTHGFLRSVALTVQTTGGSKPGRYRRPLHSADRTRSRRTRAGSRRVHRYGIERPGPAARRWVQMPDAPFEVLTNEIRP